ncbi:hypothetical protein C1645_760001 [Glomus cerebriforme]|uniref:Ubiquinol-cytochrome C reductase hinge domain-containing protein n=1 Tax=Glomus cerebriforme TaxID=658196 RepID=A0A397TAT1_9GLOM|nr:hypothetical protein C1645_760001 [Glomus cerebriforme]
MTFVITRMNFTHFFFSFKIMPVKEKKTVSIFAKAVSKCSLQATTYAKCVTFQLDSIHQNTCHKEFLDFKLCVQKCIGKSW